MRRLWLDCRRWSARGVCSGSGSGGGGWRGVLGDLFELGDGIGDVGRRDGGRVIVVCCEIGDCRVELGRKLWDVQVSGRGFVNLDVKRTDLVKTCLKLCEDVRHIRRWYAFHNKITTSMYSVPPCEYV